MTLLSIPTLPINTGLRTLFAKTFRGLANGTRAMILGTFIVWHESRNMEMTAISVWLEHWFII